MKEQLMPKQVTISFDTMGSSFGEDHYTFKATVKDLLDKTLKKISIQCSHHGYTNNVICQHLEQSQVLHDINGNPIGTVLIEWGDSYEKELERDYDKNLKQAKNLYGVINDSN